MKRKIKASPCLNDQENFPSQKWQLRPELGGGVYISFKISTLQIHRTKGLFQIAGILEATQVT